MILIKVHNQLRTNISYERSPGQKPRFRDPFKAHLEPINQLLEKFEALARSIIGERWSKRDPTPVVELKKLLVEGQASARFYHYLSQCCPIPHSHTAIMSLKSEMIDDISADENTSTPMQTECYLAIKSTAGEDTGLIWLKVVSMMMWGQPIMTEADMRTRNGTSPTPIAESRNSRSGKRQRSLNPESLDDSPPLKAAKTYAGQSMIRFASDSDADVSFAYPVREVRVCPACLAPCNGTSKMPGRPVMQIGPSDDNMRQHQIFYLPADKRPPQTSNRMTLSEVLDERRKRQYVCGKKKWIARVARLVAESVLRFDWRDARRGLRIENLIFYESRPEAFEPFHEVQIDSQNHGCQVIEQNALSARKTVLLDLSFILLQLGSPSRLSVSTHGWGIEQYQLYLNEWTRITGVAKSEGMGEMYAQVIRNCANLDIPMLEEDATVVNEDQFQKTYFENIVSPLKRVEGDLLDDIQTGSGDTINFHKGKDSAA
ncbi:hypothetical protein F5Y10DRAFT_254073 [Nemania abortiva]|nr:hypothetical protein F5Y10DRAFT_254073 [Nemania abortiva]